MQSQLMILSTLHPKLADDKLRPSCSTQSQLMTVTLSGLSHTLFHAKPADDTVWVESHIEPTCRTSPLSLFHVWVCSRAQDLVYRTLFQLLRLSTAGLSHTCTLSHLITRTVWIESPIKLAYKTLFHAWPDAQIISLRVYYIHGYC
jgi:frataxin-like iron-binding protein CyaY